MSEKSEVTTKKNKSKKPVFKWLLIGLGVVAVFVGLNYFKAQKLRNERMAAVEEQRQVLIEGWEAQGLSDEEIKEKLDSLRPSGVPGEERPGGGSGIGLMKVMSGGRKPGSHLK
ncbi:MAG: hypothetical protein HN466_04080 [Candidatus Pacebacteria bacterium]|nr:hypothetical protein [Candidatus Paceibacterota bacterium]